MHGSYFKKSEIPDGEYVVSVQKIDVGVTKEGSKPRVRLLLQIVEGPHIGKRDWKLSMLCSDSGKSMFTEEMRRAGFTVNNSAEFEEIKPELYCIHLRVAVTNQDDGYRRIEILGVAENTPIGHAASNAAPVVCAW